MVRWWRARRKCSSGSNVTVTCAFHSTAPISMCGGSEVSALRSALAIVGPGVTLQVARRGRFRALRAALCSLRILRNYKPAGLGWRAPPQVLRDRGQPQEPPLRPGSRSRTRILRHHCRRAALDLPPRRRFPVRTPAPAEPRAYVVGSEAVTTRRVIDFRIPEDEGQRSLLQIWARKRTAVAPSLGPRALTTPRSDFKWLAGSDRSSRAPHGSAQSRAPRRGPSSDRLPSAAACRERRTPWHRT